jgi:hypothetical protein
VTLVTDVKPSLSQYGRMWEATMTDNFAPAKTLCLLNENAQCNSIWMSQPGGLKLVHFLTLQTEVSGREQMPTDAEYEKCERQCVQGGHLS